MTGVPGGDVTLHAAIRQAIGDPGSITPRDRSGKDSDGGESVTAWSARAVMAVLADRLPHTPPDQFATLIGGDWETAYSDPTLSRAIGPWVPDSPPAAAQPPCTCYFTPRVLAPPCPRHPAAPEPLPAAPTEEPTPHA